MGWHDLSGTLGAALMLLAYGLLQTGRLKAEQLPYPLLNAGGALLVLHSLLQAFNLAAFLLELAWLLLSLYSLGRFIRRR